MTWSTISSLTQDLRAARHGLKTLFVQKCGASANSALLVALLSPQRRHRVFMGHVLNVPGETNSDLCPIFELATSQTKNSDFAFYGSLSSFLQRLPFCVGPYVLAGQYIVLYSSTAALSTLSANFFLTRALTPLSIVLYNNKRHRRYKLPVSVFKNFWQPKFTTIVNAFPGARVANLLISLCCGPVFFFRVLLFRVIQ